MKETFNEDFRWGMFGGFFVTVVVITLVVAIYNIGSLMTLDSIHNQCNDVRHEFKIYGKYYSCQIKDQ